MSILIRSTSALILASMLATTSVGAQEPALPPPAEAAVRYSVDGTTIGALLDDPRACAVLDKHIPGFSTNDQVDLARAMTLRGIQPFALDTMSDEVLAAVDAELSRLDPAAATPGS